MGFSIKFLACNGSCGSCYENRVREKQPPSGYDIEAIRKTLREVSSRFKPEERERMGPPCIHGGEPLLIKIEDLEALFSDIVELYGRTSIQTNALLLTDEHVELFKKHKTCVGVSLDGDTAALNLGRWNLIPLGQSVIQEGTDLALRNMKKIADAGLPMSLITVLRKYNAGDYERVRGLVRFLRRMADEFGIWHIRTNQGIVYDKDRVSSEQLTERELGAAFVALADVCFENSKFMWRPYRDVVELLLGDFNQTCIFTECDIWKTGSEVPIDAEGNVGNCLKGGGSIDGIQVLAADKYSNERYVALYQVPQEQNGCKDCRYWLICKAGCPGEGIDNDWRNRSRFCGGLKALYEHVEKKLRGLRPSASLSIDVDSKKPQALSQVHGDSHSDEHGDRPHGDHSDDARRKS